MAPNHNTELTNGVTHNETSRSNDKKQSVSDFRRALPQFCVVGVKNLILLGWGLLMGYPTILIPGLQGKGGSSDNATQADFILSEEQVSWVGSINLLCVPVGSLTSAIFMERIGKRRMMQLLNVPMLCAWAIFYFATDVWQIYVGLGLSGMSGGLLEAPLLIYIAETVEPQYRGMLTASGTATAYVGVFLAFIIGSMLHWRTVAAISAIIPFLALNAVFLVPESPYWLYAKDRVDDAHKSLQWLRGWVSHRNVEEEFKEVISSVEDLKATKKPRQTDRNQVEKRSKLQPFTKRNFIVPFLLILFGFITSHFSGITPLQTYSIQILSSYHVPINEYYATIFLGAVEVIGCLIGMALIRSFGKRRLVFASFIGCGICFFAVATQSHFSDGSHQFDITPTPATLNMSIDNLEQNVLNAIVSLRTRYQIEKDIGNVYVKPTNQTIQSASNRISIMNHYHHINPDILHEAQHLLDEMHVQSSNDPKLNMFTVSNLPVDENNRRYSEQIDNSIIRNEIGAVKLFELLNITKNIIVTFIPNVLPKNHVSQFSIGTRVDDIERDMWNILVSNVTINESHLDEKVRELSTTLANVAGEIRLGRLAETETNYRWLPLILLLGGSMFAHAGAKLFPWMLIGEVYSMEVRSAAAGLSSCFGYLVAFTSNKVFLNMVAIFTLNGTFWIYSCVSAVGVIVLYFTLPETENKTLQEIQVYFVKNKNKRDLSKPSNNHVNV